MTQSVNKRWIFDLNRLQDNRSKRDGIGHHQQIHLRQKGTNLIRDMSKELKLRPICMNTGIVYFHRFFALRSFKTFDVNQIAVCSLFVSSKFEEQPIFKEHIIKVSLYCRQKEFTPELYREECDKLVENENEMLLTFGFDLSVTHFQTVICTASEADPIVFDETIRKKSYIIAGDLLRLSTICLEFPPKFAACICIYLSSTLLNIPIKSTNWCQLIDPELKLPDIESEAKRFKSFVNMSRLSADEKKRKESFDASNSSPESAYSSGSGTSPNIDFERKSEAISTNNKKLNKRIFNQLYDKYVDKNPNIKRIRTNSGSSSSLAEFVKLKSKTVSSSVSDPNNQTLKARVLSNKSSVKPIQNHSNSKSETPLKAVKPMGEVVRVAAPIPQTNTSAQVAVNCLSKVVNQSKSSSLIAKRTSDTCPTIGTTQNNTLHKGIQKLNLKITFSTSADSNTSDKRIVRNGQQTVKIES